jgi:hypothetical protein
MESSRNLGATYVLAAVILDIWAFLPVCLSPLWVSVKYLLATWRFTWERRVWSLGSLETYS